MYTKWMINEWYSSQWDVWWKRSWHCARAVARYGSHASANGGRAAQVASVHTRPWSALVPSSSHIVPQGCSYTISQLYTTYPPCSIHLIQPRHIPSAKHFLHRPTDPVQTCTDVQSFFCCTALYKGGVFYRSSEGWLKGGIDVLLEVY